MADCEMSDKAIASQTGRAVAGVAHPLRAW